MANENKLEEIIRTSLESIRSMVDANTVIGSPIATENGVTIIPISKVSVGYASGGLDFNGKNPQPPKHQSRGAGGGAGISVQPIGLLCVSRDGSVELINIGIKNPTDPMEQLSDIIERAPEIIARVKALFSKDKDQESEEEDSDEE